MNGPLVIVGDALLDVDLIGEVTRVAPDAPVPVVDETERRPRPGGAGLAALLAARDGHEVVLVTALGDDEAGEHVEHLLRGVTVLRLPYDGATPVKMRVRAEGQSMLRIDSGNRRGTVGEPGEHVADALSAAGAVLVADYGRGATGQQAVRRLLTALPTRVPMTWDPHPRGATPVPGTRLVTPNRAEAALFAGRHGVATSAGSSPLAAVARSAAGLVVAWQAQAVAVTLSEHGALLSYGDGAPVVIPAPSVQAVDACGAGDRFAVSAALALGAGHITSEAVQAAVESAATFVAAGGAAAITASPEGTGSGERGPSAEPVEVTDAAPALVRRVSAAGGVVVATGGCFDLLHAGHVATLREARRLGDCLVVCLNSDASVRRLKGPSRPLVPASDRVRVLEALECVDAVVVFDEDTPVEAIKQIRPHVWAKGGDYAGQEVPEAAVVESWGGQVVVLPYLQGRSTSTLMQTAAERAQSSDLR